MPYQDLQKAQLAAGSAADKASKAVDTMTNGNAPIRMLATVGLGASVYANGIHLINIFRVLTHPFSSLTNVYLTLTGLVCLLLEGVDCFPCIPGLRNGITHRFPFLDRTGGRGVTYFVLGSLTAGEGSGAISGMIGFIAGGFLMLIGIMMGLVARSAKSTLDSIANGHVDEAVELFPTYAKVREGNASVLNAEGLAGICEKLGKPLTPNQAAAALTMMDADQSGGISLEEFKVFWKKLSHEAF
mmetsp:Transcript_47177/g.109092  ORF Transcript_47177/g.109092 Transcript_47177/m.109092 type:complete len:243 (-) Transcript_47177:107-835(-)